MTPFEYEPSLDDPDDDPGGCEHGDHPNRDPSGNRRVCPEGRRFCSQACADCEAADFDEAAQCCAGLCGFPNAIGGPAEPAVATERRYCNRCAAERPHFIARVTRTCCVCGDVGSNGPAAPQSHAIAMHPTDRLVVHADTARRRVPSEGGSK
jgi:hypothetical protein